MATTDATVYVRVPGYFEDANQMVIEAEAETAEGPRKMRAAKGNGIGRNRPGRVGGLLGQWYWQGNGSDATRRQFQQYYVFYASEELRDRIHAVAEERGWRTSDEPTFGRGDYSDMHEGEDA